MRKIRNILITLSGLVLTAILLGVVFLFVDNIEGTIVLLLGAICLFALFFIMLVGLIKGDIKFLKLNGRFSMSLVISYIVVTSMLLCVMWFANFVIHERFGDLSASEKMSFIFGNKVESKELQKVAGDYPVLEHDHITFRYHPDTEKLVNEIINTMESITELEKEIFGREITKNEKLEVIALRNSKDYIQLHPFSTETVGGSYDSSNKRATVYQERESFDDDESFMIGTFAHEYSHYLIDLFLAEEGLNDNDIPAWYKEGICEFFRYEIVDTITIHEKIDTGLKYTDLHTSENWNAASENTDVYYLAKRAIEYIVEHQGDVKDLSTILLHQKETGSFEESFDQITGLQLNTLNETIFSVKKDLQKAWDAWWQESDIVTAEKLYEELTKKHPNESLAWHQYALILEEQKKWDEALNARRKVISIDPEKAAGFLNISYLLTIIDSKEAMEMANIALELTKKEPYGNVKFVQKWVDEISQYHDLKSEESYVEAYQAIFQSEHLSNDPTILEELKKQEKEKSPSS